MPSFKCRNIGKKCRFEVEADTDSQVLEAVLEHVEKAHEKGPIPRETVEQIKKAIKK
jgi:predicted small metal-binding protein